MKKPIIQDNIITIPSSQNFLPDVDDFVEGLLKKHKIEASIIADIAISVTEMVINCITHGNQSDVEKSVSVKVEIAGAAAKISVTDEGSGFNPGEVESPIEDKNLLKEVGRGIFITKSLMDSVDFEPLANGGTRVVLRKQF